MSLEKNWQNRIIGNGYEEPSSLLANPQNHRIHPFKQQKVMGEMLETVGWVQQILVNFRTGTVIDGHMRVMLALRNGEQTVPVVYVDLTIAEEGLVLAAFDRIGDLAVTEGTVLDELLADVNRSFNFSTGDSALARLLDEMKDTANVDRLIEKVNPEPLKGVDQNPKMVNNNKAITGIAPEQDLPDKAYFKDRVPTRYLKLKINARLYTDWQRLWGAIEGDSEQRLASIIALANRQLIRESENTG